LNFEMGIESMSKRYHGQQPWSNDHNPNLAQGPKNAGEPDVIVETKGGGVHLNKPVQQLPIRLGSEAFKPAKGLATGGLA
jgi:hypothetical protein